MSQQVLEANQINRAAAFYPMALTPELAEISPGEHWRIIAEHRIPVAIYRLDEYAIVARDLSGYAYTRSAFYGKRVFETEPEIVQKLAEWITQTHALLIAAEQNIIAPTPSRSFNLVTAQLRATITSLIDAQIDLIVNP